MNQDAIKVEAGESRTATPRRLLVDGERLVQEVHGSQTEVIENTSRPPRKVVAKAKESTSRSPSHKHRSFQRRTTEEMLSITMETLNEDERNLLASVLAEGELAVPSPQSRSVAADSSFEQSRDDVACEDTLSTLWSTLPSFSTSRTGFKGKTARAAPRRFLFDNVNGWLKLASDHKVKPVGDVSFQGDQVLPMLNTHQMQSGSALHLATLVGRQKRSCLDCRSTL